MQMVLADWLREHIPVAARVVVHDVSVVRFLGERHTVDTVGLTTVGAVDAYRHGPGALYEFFAALRPEYYAGYPSVAPPYFGISTAPGFVRPGTLRRVFTGLLTLRQRDGHAARHPF